MKKLILRGLSVLMLAFTATAAGQAQDLSQIPPLPTDPALRTGVLDNGMTYYIRHNNTPKGQADFYIAQKVGSILEEDNQRGLAHFLEHMCFNGTKNFPGKGIINYLESVGVKFGYNLNAYTSVDETVYNISSVPVARTGVQDSCLLILHDWANALTLDDEEINAERGVIHEEWRRSNQGAMRIIEEQLPKVYAGGRYGYRLPIGTMEVVDNFDPQVLRDYYHTWYRPDQQAIIVVGDIDVDYIENKIKEIFAPIPMPADAKPREYFTVDDTPGTIFAIGKDKEMSVGAFDLMFKYDLLIPVELRNTQMYYPVDYMTHMVQAMLNSRLSDLAKQPDAEFASARVSFGDFFLAKTKGAFDVEAYAKGNSILPALEAVYREVLRAARGGFTVGEYERARAEFISQIEKMYESRNDRDNTSYAREYVKLFTENIPAPGIELEKQLYDAISQMVTVDQLNTLLPEILKADNRVFMAMLPDNETFGFPQEEEVAAIINGVEAEDIAPYRDEMRTDPLIPFDIKAGKIKSTRHLDEWDATEYTLSNGVKVIVKPTTFKNNEVYFCANAKGKGTSTIDQSLAPTVKFLDYAINRHSLFNYNSSDIQKYLQGKQAYVDVDIDTYVRQVDGNSTAKDLPTLMELIYATFSGFDIAESDFAATQSSISAMLANQESTPDYIFSKNLLKSLYAAESKQAISTADIAAAEREASVEIVRNALDNAADFTFVFVGNIDEEIFKPLMCQYIGSLKGNAKKATKKFTTDSAFELPLGNETNYFTTAMETPQTWAFVGVFGKTPYTAENKVLASIAGQILSKRLLDKVREEMGATYSIGAGSMLTRTGDVNTIIQVPFPMKPEMKDEVLAAVHSIINDMTSTVKAEELNPVKEYMIKDAAESLEKNDEWVNAISATGLNGVQTFTNAADVINGITVESVQTFMRQLLDQNNYRVVILDPAK